MKRFILAAAGLVSAVSGMAQATVGCDIFMFDMRGTTEFFSVNLANPTTRNFISTNMSPFTTFAMDFNANATDLYAFNNTDRTLGTLDLNTGAYTSIAPVTGLPDGINPTGLKFAPNNTAYLSTYDATLGNQIYTLDINTGVASAPVSISGANLGILIDFAIDANGNFYGHDIGQDGLVSIDLNTGAATLIGLHGLAANFAQGMDFDWDSNTLYATIYTGGGTGQFVSWNTTDGSVTTIVNTGTEGWNMELEMAVACPIPAPGVLGAFATAGLIALRRRR